MLAITIISLTFFIQPLFSKTIPTEYNGGLMTGINGDLSSGTNGGLMTGINGDLSSGTNGDLSSGINEDPDDYLVEFMLYTRENPDKFHLIQLANEASLARSQFDPHKIVKIVVHGWLKTYESPMGILFKDVFLKRYDANVILVDWSSESQKNYVSSRLAVTKIGNVVAHLVDTLVKYGTPLSSIHILGHSLGAHVAGIAGLNVQSGKISRVTGLDPAGPFFSESDTYRLRPDSAEFVDVIHSCGHVLGFFGQLGQVDFYPNKGTYEQPGCGFDYKGKCSHGRSYYYYAESVTSDGFLSVQCSDWEAFTEGDCAQPAIPMGEDVPRSAKGKYYLKTNKSPPFAMGTVEF